MIDVVVVDLGGVAARYRPERRLEALGAASGLPASVIHERIFESGLDEAAENGAYAASELVELILTALEHRVSRAGLIDAWALAFEPDNAVLDQIVVPGGQAALFTNNGPMLDACLDGPLSRLKSCFAEIICSWQLRVRKPAPEAFEGTALRLDAAPEGLLLLDDATENVEAARRCGWNAECVSGVADVIAAPRKYAS